MKKHVHIKVHAIVNGTEVFPEYCTQHYGNEGWTVSLPTMSLVFGRKVPRRHVPLANVLDFELVDAAGTGCPHEQTEAMQDELEQAFAAPSAEQEPPAVGDHDAEIRPAVLTKNPEALVGRAMSDAVAELTLEHGVTIYYDPPRATYFVTSGKAVREVRLWDLTPELMRAPDADQFVIDQITQAVLAVAAEGE